MRVISIKQKLMLITMASSAVALLLIASAFLTYEWFSVRRMMVQDLSTLAEIIGSQSTGAITFGYNRDAEEILKALSAKKHVMAAVVYKGGDLFATYYAPGQAQVETAPAHPGPEGWSFTGDRLIVCRPIEMNGTRIGAIYLSSNLEELHARLWSYLMIVLVFMLASLAATCLLAARLQRIISRPISHLAQTAKTVSEDRNYAIRAQRESGDELGQLIDGFNEMLAQIQERDNALKGANDRLEKRVEERTRDLRQQFDRISLLNQITYAVAARKDFNSIVQVVIGQLEERLPIDYGSAYVLDAPTNTFRTMVRGPKGKAIAAQIQMPDVLPVAETIFGPCLLGEMVYHPDLSQVNMPLSQKLAQAGLLSALGVPLVVEDKVFGLLVLERRNRDGFSLAERDFVRALSAHVALAIHQAQLYQDLRKAYDELHQTQQTVMQQERLKAVGQMASGIAHDINNALSPVVGFAELIAQTEASLTEDGKKYLQYIKTAGMDVAQIVGRLREFYRPRDPEESLQPLDLNRVAGLALDMTRPRWRDIPQGRGIMIEVRTNFDPRLPSFSGIESELREAITNLIINAVDALPHGGALEVRTRTEKSDSGEQAVLEISDTGVGMDEQTRKRCLEPFFSTKGQLGTGLGLAMVYGVMERHEGRIEIDSELGKGTTMRLVFPVRKLDKTQKTHSAGDVPPGPFRILCIDDEPSVRKLLGKMLELDRHQVQTTDGGKAGLEAFRTANSQGQPFDVVITDLGMPYLDGREVAKILKHESPGVPIIMMTGWGVFMKEDAGILTQVDGILSKPPNLQELREMLRRVVRRQLDPPA